MKGLLSFVYRVFMLDGEENRRPQMPGLAHHAGSSNNYGG